jgi:hypothetical protein
MLLGGEKVDRIIQSGVNFQTGGQAFLGDFKIPGRLLQAEQIGPHT